MRDWGCAFVHAPLQKVGDILIKNISNRIHEYEDKRICACRWIALFCINVYLCSCVYLVTLANSAGVYVYKCMCVNVNVRVCECVSVLAHGHMGA